MSEGAYTDAEIDAIRLALIEGEESGIDESFDFGEFLQRELAQHSHISGSAAGSTSPRPGDPNSESR